MLATQTQQTPAFAAFEQQLKTLCLREFPCGLGTWVRLQPLALKFLHQQQ